MVKRLITVAAIALLLLPAAVSCAEGLPERSLVIATAGGVDVALRVEVAADDAARARGLMFRKSVPDGTGMLFVYEEDQIFSFWMKDTPVALSIAFIASDGRIAEIHDMRPYSLTSVTSSRSLRYALEVPAGWFSRAGVAVGDVVRGID